MAFLAYDPELDPNKKQQEQQATNVSGASTTFDNQPPGSQVGKPKSSGQFANIQGYLNANKEQGAQMGSKLVSNVEQNAQQAQGDIQKLAGEKQAAAVVNPSQYLSNPAAANKTEYQALRQSGGYTGPNDVSQTQNYQTAANSATKANELVKASGTEEGRMNLLQQTYQRPTYSRGMQKLDQVLLQNDPTSKQQFADLNQKYSNISSLFDNTANEVGNSINQAKQTALSNKQAIVAAENQAKLDLMNPIQQRVAQANANNAELIKRVSGDVSDDVLNDETLAALGLTEGQNLYDLNLSSYLTPDNTTVGINNAANSEERARYSALAALLDDPTMNQITADGKSINPIKLNKEQFDKDLAAKKAIADKAMSEFSVNVTPGSFGPGFTYDNPFNVNAINYDQYNKFSSEADKFFSQFGSNYRYDPSNYDQFASSRQALVDAALRAGIANDQALKETPRDALIMGLEQARNKYQAAQKNYGIERRIKKG